MIPLKDTIRSATFPLTNWIFIILNAIVFLYELTLSPARLELFIQNYGLVPAHVNPLNPVSLLPFLTSMFIHSGWFHILSNMWVLFIFGDNVEDRMGSGRYFFFYLLSGFAAGLLQYFVMPTSEVPSIGASGAIAGVLGAYFLFYPRARVLTLIPIIIIPWFVEIPAIVYLGFWFVSQLFSGLLSLGAPAAQSGGVAWWAHVGGFLFGLIAARLFAIRKQPTRWYPDQYYPW
ncbi:MAG TPA: rhomboid family intramembrane serine protease [Anaerolineaceae bacterium]|nr:rhomboid family intramembrane serine protease [Anaerolineaceae bacterium]